MSRVNIRTNSQLSPFFFYRLKEEDSSDNETDSSDKSLSRTEVQSISSESADVPKKKYQKSLRLSSDEIVSVCWQHSIAL